VRDRDDVLWITFEDLKEDLAGSVKKVAEFLQIECDDQMLAMVSRESRRHTHHRVGDTRPHASKTLNQATSVQPVADDAAVCDRVWAGGRPLVRW